MIDLDYSAVYLAMPWIVIACLGPFCLALFLSIDTKGSFIKVVST